MLFNQQDSAVQSARQSSCCLHTQLPGLDQGLIMQDLGRQMQQSEQNDLGAGQSNGQLSTSVKQEEKNRLFLVFSITFFCQQQDTDVHRVQISYF